MRCGACLKIFVADDNLVPSPDLRTMDAPPPAQQNEQGEEQQLHLDDHDFEREFADSIFTLDLADSLPNRFDPSISEHEPIWELLDEGAPLVEELLAADPEHEDAPEDALEDALEDAPENLVQQESVMHQEITTRAFEQEEQLPSFGAAEFHEQSLEDDRGVRTHFTPENLAAARDLSDPLELHWQPPARRGRYIVLMSAMTIVLAAGLLAQFVWYNMDDLSQNVIARPWLERACKVAGCSLPPLIDIGSISSDNLLVRSHTEIANALSVNLVFRNDAAFAQPFPALNLRFTDVNNTVVAERRFTPEEYLAPGIATMGMMPAGSPVQVVLNILDPGNSAVNYEVSFSPMFSRTRL